MTRAKNTPIKYISIFISFSFLLSCLQLEDAFASQQIQNDSSQKQKSSDAGHEQAVADAVDAQGAKQAAIGSANDNAMADASNAAQKSANAAISKRLTSGKSQTNQKKHRDGSSITSKTKKKRNRTTMKTVKRDSRGKVCYSIVETSNVDKKGNTKKVKGSARLKGPVPGSFSYSVTAKKTTIKLKTNFAYVNLTVTKGKHVKGKVVMGNKRYSFNGKGNEMKAAFAALAGPAGPLSYMINNIGSEKDESKPEGGSDMISTFAKVVGSAFKSEKSVDTRQIAETDDQNDGSISVGNNDQTKTYINADGNKVAESFNADGAMESRVTYDGNSNVKKQSEKWDYKNGELSKYSVSDGNGNKVKTIHYSDGVLTSVQDYDENGNEKRKTEFDSNGAWTKRTDSFYSNNKKLAYTLTYTPNSKQPQIRLADQVLGGGIGQIRIPLPSNGNMNISVEGNNTAATQLFKKHNVQPGPNVYANYFGKGNIFIRTDRSSKVPNGYIMLAANGGVYPYLGNGNRNESKRLGTIDKAVYAQLRSLGDQYKSASGARKTNIGKQIQNAIKELKGGDAVVKAKIVVDPKTKQAYAVIDRGDDSSLDGKKANFTVNIEVVNASGKKNTSFNLTVIPSSNLPANGQSINVKTSNNKSLSIKVLDSKSGTAEVTWNGQKGTGTYNQEDKSLTVNVGNKKVRVEFGDGKTVTKVTKITSTEGTKTDSYSYDGNGNLRSSEHQDKNSTSVDKWTYSNSGSVKSVYNNGALTTVTRHNAQGKAIQVDKHENGRVKTRTNLNTSGQAVQIAELNANGSVKAIQSLSYNNGQLAKIDYKNGSGKLQRTEEYSNGNVVKETVWAANGLPLTISTTKNGVTTTEDFTNPPKIEAVGPKTLKASDRVLRIPLNVTGGFKYSVTVQTNNNTAATQLFKKHNVQPGPNVYANYFGKGNIFIRTDRSSKVPNGYIMLAANGGVYPYLGNGNRNESKRLGTIDKAVYAQLRSLGDQYKSASGARKTNIGKQIQNAIKELKGGDAVVKAKIVVDPKTKQAYAVIDRGDDSSLDGKKANFTVNIEVVNASGKKNTSFNLTVIPSSNLPANGQSINVKTSNNKSLSIKVLDSKSGTAEVTWNGQKGTGTYNQEDKSLTVNVGNKKVRVEFGDGKTVTKVTKITSTEGTKTDSYSYDGNGNLRSSEHQDKNSTSVDKWTYSNSGSVKSVYNNGALTTVTRHNAQGKAIQVDKHENGRVKTRTNLNTSGQAVQIAELNANGSVKAIQSLSYNNGQLAKIDYKNGSGKLQRTEEYSNGNVVKETVWAANGLPLTISTTKNGVTTTEDFTNPPKIEAVGPKTLKASDRVLRIPLNVTGGFKYSVTVQTNNNTAATQLFKKHNVQPGPNVYANYFGKGNIFIRTDRSSKVPNGYIMLAANGGVYPYLGNGNRNESKRLGTIDKAVYAQLRSLGDQYKSASGARKTNIGKQIQNAIKELKGGDAMQASVFIDPNTKKPTLQVSIPQGSNIKPGAITVKVTATNASGSQTQNIRVNLQA